MKFRRKFQNTLWKMTTIFSLAATRSADKADVSLCSSRTMQCELVDHENECTSVSATFRFLFQHLVPNKQEKKDSAMSSLDRFRRLDLSFERSLKNSSVQLRTDRPKCPTEPDLLPGMGIFCLLRQILESSFSAVSTPIFATQDSFCGV